MSSETLEAELSRRVRQTQAQERLPSVSAAVFRSGEVGWAEAVGHANAETGEEATSEHQYRVGAITKTFTAAAIMQLRDAGELDPDVLLPETAAEMRTFQGLADPERWTQGYGLGLVLTRAGDRIFFGHTGGVPGFVTCLVYSASGRAGAAALTNGSHGYKAPELAVELATNACDALAVGPEPWRPAEPAPSELAGVLGSWWFERQEVVFRWRDGKLEARSPSDPPHVPPSVFAPESDGRYRVISGPERGELLRIVRGDSGAPVKLYIATYPFIRTPKSSGS